MSLGDDKVACLVELDESERLLARVVAAMRTGLSRISGTPDSKRSNRDGFEIDLEGVGGELAFAKMMNLFPDFGALPRSGGRDFTSRKKQSIDVKTTDHPNGNLLVSTSKVSDPCDLYVLMIGAFPSYEYVGYAPKETVFMESNHVTLPHGKAYRVMREELVT